MRRAWRSPPGRVVRRWAPPGIATAPPCVVRVANAVSYHIATRFA